MRVVRAIIFLLITASVCLAQDASSAIVNIRGTQNGSAVSGTGFIAAPNGTIVTNLHLVKGLSNPKVELVSGDIFDSFMLVAGDARRDLAIIRIAGFDLPYIALGNSNQVRIGDAVALVQGASPQKSSVRGLVAADGFRAIELAADPSAAASGGVLLGADGKAIGVLGYRSTSALAIPINYARGMLDIAPGEVAKAGLPAHAEPPAKPEVAREPAVSVMQPLVVKTPPTAAPSAPAPEPVATAMPTPVAPPHSPVPTSKSTPPVSSASAPAMPAPVAIPTPEPKIDTPVVRAAEKRAVVDPASPAPKTETTPSTPVRKIYIEPIGEGEGPSLLHDDIVRYLEQSHFQVVDTRDGADAVLSGTAKFANIRVEKFRARLTGTDDRELWSGELSTGGWIRAASGTIARALVKNIVHAVGQPGVQP